MTRPTDPDLRHSDHGPAQVEVPASDSLTSGASQVNTLTGVRWSMEEGLGMTFLSGNASFAVALTASFSSFIVSGVRFSIVSGSAGATTVNFSYQGTLSVQAVHSLVVAGAQVFLSS